MKLAIPDFNPVMIIDTSRNGVPDSRKDCGNYCNIKTAGAGHRPTTTTEDSTLIDAYLWLRTPGLSDGCTKMLADGSECSHFDSVCAGADSIGTGDSKSLAPEAGQWFEHYVKLLADNANLDGTSYVESHFMSYMQ